jgi:hypothetical protein
LKSVTNLVLGVIAQHLLARKLRRDFASRGKVAYLSKQGEIRKDGGSSTAQ